jgi:hypothetical protein
VKQTKLLIILLTLFCIPVMALAQVDQCPAVVQTALEAVDQSCQGTGRNQVCYGNLALEAQPQPEVSELQFEQVGDIADVAALQSLKLTALDVRTQEWGVAWMQLQANLPDTLPGQNVSVLLFGDVEVTNAVTSEEKDLTPMQAFYFRSGIGVPGCEEVPESGIIVQTPDELEEKVSLVVNEVNIELGSTAYLRAQPGEMTVSTLEGEAQIEAFGIRQIIPAGMWAKIPLDEDYKAANAPEAPKPETEDLSILPLSAFEREFELVPVATQTPTPVY